MSFTHQHTPVDVQLVSKGFTIPYSSCDRYPSWREIQSAWILDPRTNRDFSKLIDRVIIDQSHLHLHWNEASHFYVFHLDNPSSSKTEILALCPCYLARGLTFIIKGVCCSQGLRIKKPTCWSGINTGDSSGWCPSCDVYLLTASTHSYTGFCKFPFLIKIALITYGNRECGMWIDVPSGLL